MATEASLVTYDIDVELKSPANAVWSAIKDLNVILPKSQPETYESAEIIEGDGKSVGSIYLVNSARGAKSTCGNYYKVKCESLDEENKTVVYRYIDGDIMKYYKSFDNKITVKAKGEGSMVVSTCIYEKIFFMAPEGEMMRPAHVERLQMLDAFLQRNDKN